MYMEMDKFVRIVVVCWINLNLGFSKEGSNNEKSVYAQTVAFSPDERYRDLFPLTNENFTENLLRNKDPWIVVFHDGSAEREWKTMATHLRGLCWFGLVDITVENDLLAAIDYDMSQGPARFYPYGDRRTKERKWRSVRNQNEARTEVLASLPDKTQRVSGDGFRDLLLESFTSQPSRFPAILMLDENDTPPVFKAIAKRFEKYYLFGRLIRPTSGDLHKLGLQNMYVNPPELFVIVAEDRRPEKVDAIKFDKDKFGNMNYTSIMQFLFAVNGQFRHDLPGNSMADKQQEAEMADVVRIEEKRFEIIRNIGDKLRHAQKVDDEKVELNLKAGRRIGTKDEL